MTYGIYIHIPFCTSKCPYCDFYSLPADPVRMDLYTAALRRAIAAAPLEAGAVVDSIYFGGGTPILMGERLCTVLEALRERFAVTPDAEITLEANPNATDLKTLIALRRAGFGRISFGVQSADSTQLRTLGRTHTAQGAAQAVALARQAGFPAVSVDIMLGLPQQTLEEVAATVEFCAGLEVEHISAYLLKIEPATPFAGRYTEEDIDDEVQADIYLQTVEQLRGLGYAQYEISNFAKPGYESRHNLKYWQCRPYLGLGPAAASYFQGRRFVFPRDLEGFLTAEDVWTLPQDEGAGGDWEESLMMSLRLNSGLELRAFARQYPQVDLSALRRRAKPLAAAGLLTETEEALALTPQGMLLSNRVILHLLG